MNGQQEVIHAQDQRSSTSELSGRVKRSPSGAQLKISRSAVKEYQERANKAGLAWPLPDTLSEQELEQKLFSPPLTIEAPAKALPDFEYIYQELKTHKKFNLTLDLLWQEYKEQHPEGYQYSQFCELYRRYRGKLDYSMRQDHRGGEKLFVDYGEGLKLVDPQSGCSIRLSSLSPCGARPITPLPKPLSLNNCPTG